MSWLNTVAYWITPQWLRNYIGNSIVYDTPTKYVKEEETDTPQTPDNTVKKQFDTVVKDLPSYKDYNMKEQDNFFARDVEALGKFLAGEEVKQYKEKDEYNQYCLRSKGIRKSPINYKE